jgi:prepilin-type N-terminal cleavage/methylation domain-containing protein
VQRKQIKKLRRNLEMKKLNKKGFTLAELLVVVAIIGVLVAVSVPIFTAQLRKSKNSRQMKANVRAAKAAAIAEFMSDDTIDTTKAGDNNFSYDVEKGTITKATATATGKNGVWTTIGVKITVDGSGNYTVVCDPTEDIVKTKLQGE